MGWGHFLVLADRVAPLESFLAELGHAPDPMVFHLYGMDQDHPEAGRVAVLVGTDCGFTYTCTVCGHQRCPGCGDGGRFDEDAGTMTCNRCAGDSVNASLTLEGAVLFESGSATVIRGLLADLRARQAARDHFTGPRRRLPPPGATE